jgi:hypothetical protein
MSGRGANGRSLAPGNTGIVLVITATCVVGIYASVVLAVETRTRSEIEAELQSAANAVAVGSVSQLPKGGIAVLRTASKILGSQKSARLASQEVEVGFWDAASEAFTTGASQANAVRITIRVGHEAGALSTFVRGSQPIEVRAVAVRAPDKALIAEKSVTARGARR